MSLDHALSQWVSFGPGRPQADRRLFCFPYAGGGANLFRQWAQAPELSARLEICPIRLPGREARRAEQPYARLAELVPVLTEALRPWLDRPFEFFGHSMGALIAFEVARHLRRQNLPEPQHLYLSARPAPHLPRPNREIPTYLLPPAAFWARLERLNGTPAAVLANPDLKTALEPTLRADFALCETYRYRPELPLSYPMTAFGGLEDRSVSPDYLRAWQEQTSSAFRLMMLPGDHFFLHSHQFLLLTELG